jgi:ubiquinone/menaquinone biosynthesis C-methylase UbiE
MFQQRSYKLERLDTGDYTESEYEVCLSELRIINRYIGDTWSLKRTLLREIGSLDLREFSVLDVGAGSGELLREIAKFGRKTMRKTELCGLEYNARSAESILGESTDFGEISSIRGDGFSLPFADGAFDFVICSLFTHHFADENVVKILAEMSRVSRRKIFVIDLERHFVAYRLYRLFCLIFGMSPMVTEDGSLSVLRGFKVEELEEMAKDANLTEFSATKYFPFRIVLSGK